MLLIAVELILFICIVIYSEQHGLGVLVLIFMAHGVLVKYLGTSAIHLPLYSALIVAASIIIRDHWKGVDIRFISLFGALICLMTLASLFGLDQGNSLGELLLYIKAFLLALLIGGFLRDPDGIKIISIYCLLGAFIGAMITVYQYKTGTFTINSIYEQRAAGLRGDPNDTAMLLVGGLPIAAYWFLQTKQSLIKLFYGFTFVSLITGVILTSSRGGFVALVIVLAMLYIKIRSIKTTGVFVALILSIILIAPNALWDRMSTIVTGQKNLGGASVEGRLNLLSQGLTAFLDNPILGVGAGNFAKARGLVIKKEQSFSELAVDSHHVAHNLYLEFFVENGIIAGIILLIIFYYAFLGLWNLNDHDNKETKNRLSIGIAISISIVGLLFSCLFLSQGKNSVLWFFIGLGIASWNMNNLKTISMAKLIRKNEKL